MSVVFLVAPILAPAVTAAGWPILCGAVAGAASLLGYNTLKSESATVASNEERVSVDIPVEGAEGVTASIRRESEFTIARDDITAVFRRYADGQCRLHVSGTNRTEAELESIGSELLGRVVQQYAYNRVVTELKSKGYVITGEETAADQTIRINVCKHVE